LTARSAEEDHVNSSPAAARRPVKNSSGHGQNNREKQLLRAPGARDDDDDDYDDDDDGGGEDLAGLNTHTHTRPQTRLDEETAAGRTVNINIYNIIYT